MAPRSSWILPICCQRRLVWFAEGTFWAPVMNCPRRKLNWLGWSIAKFGISALGLPRAISTPCGPPCNAREAQVRRDD